MELQDILKRVLRSTEHNPQERPLKTNEEIYKYFVGSAYGCSTEEGFIYCFGSGVIEYKSDNQNTSKKFKSTEVKKHLLQIYKSLYFPTQTNEISKQLSLF